MQHFELRVLHAEYLFRLLLLSSQRRYQTDQYNRSFWNVATRQKLEISIRMFIMMLESYDQNDTARRCSPLFRLIMYRQPFPSIVLDYHIDRTSDCILQVVPGCTIIQVFCIYLAGTEAYYS